jgi:hypothetical protein
MLFVLSFVDIGLAGYGTRMVLACLGWQSESAQNAFSFFT